MNQTNYLKLIALTIMIGICFASTIKTNKTIKEINNKFQNSKKH